jgi:hypothetical protein
VSGLARPPVVTQAGLQTPQFLILATAKLPFIIKGINTAGQALDQKQIRDLRPPAAASAASRGVLNPSFPHSLNHARASTVAILLRSSIKYDGETEVSAPYLLKLFQNFKYKKE